MKTLEQPKNKIVETALDHLYANPDIRSVGRDWNGAQAELPDNRVGEVVGNYWETSLEDGSRMKMLVAIPDAKNAECVVTECSTAIKLHTNLGGSARIRVNDLTHPGWWNENRRQG